MSVAMLPPYCRRKGDTIQVRYPVPALAQEALGKRYLHRSLGRVTVAMARKLAPDVISEMQRQIRKLEERPRQTLDSLLGQIDDWALAKSPTENSTSAS